MRLFIAVNLSKRARNLLQRKVNTIQQEINDENVKWVKPKNWHLTLKFLGDTPENKLDDIEGVIEEISNKFEPFYIQYTGVGAFPHLKYPRVIYIGTDKGSKIVTDLQNKLEKRMAKIGFSPEDREYKPHITIGRGKKSADFTQLSRDIKNYANKEFYVNVVSPVEKISLMKSELYPEGPVYKEIFAKILQ